MIVEGTGNLLEADVEAIVNTVNTVGVMGKGIALQFKQAFPDNYKAYREACKRGEVRIGEMFLFDTHRLGPRRYVINFPTKQHWRARSRLVDIELGLTALVETLEECKINSVAIPALGCGNGGLDWHVVRPLIVSAFERLPDVTAKVFAPSGSPDPNRMPFATGRPEMTRGRAALIALVNGYVKLARAERVEASSGASLLEIQKLMYLLQVSGEPLQLGFAKGRYGPYAENLNHQLQTLEGHFIRGYGDRSQRVLDFEPITLTPAAVPAADAWLAQDSGTLLGSIQDVLKLVEGFASPYGLELLSTVHWAVAGELPMPGDLVATIQSWNDRKAAIFTERHIEIALAQLARHGYCPSGSLP